MFGEKKHWRLPTPFRRFSGKQGLQSKGHSGSRVSSVYLSDNSSANGFIVVPEFDGPKRSQTTQESSPDRHQFKPSGAAPSTSPLSLDGVDNLRCNVEPKGFGYSTYTTSSCNATVSNTSWDDDLSRRLGSAYKHIQSMPSAVSPNVSLSSDPVMLRKQLGVPQHSVFNHPIHSLPDLPNPHTPSLEAQSPRSSPPASPGLPSMRMSKLGSRTSTNVNSVSFCDGSPDPSHAKKKSAVIVPTLTENSFLPTPEPRFFTPNPLKVVKRYSEKPIVSPPPLPTPRRQALRGVLRKPVAGAAPSANAHSRQISLPQIRPPSPLKVNIPLHHTWHDRKADFNPSPECRRLIRLQTKSRRTTGSTEVLASLAWIGTLPVTSSSYIVNRRCHPANQVFSPDRFNMAIAVEDDNISDDLLIDQLERVRKVDGISECGDVSSPKSPDMESSSARDENGPLRTPFPSSSLPTSNQLAKPHNTFLPSPRVLVDRISESEDAEVWRAARRALLCIREIIRTEKKYQEALKLLLNAQTATPPPPSMVPYILALVNASKMLLKCFLEDPSAWGVSTAFVASEDELEVAMVSWCTVAGGFFVDGNDLQSSGLMGRWRLRKSRVTSSPSSSVREQSSASVTPRLPPVFPMIDTADRIREPMDEEYGAWKYLQAEQERRTASDSIQKSESTNSQAQTSKPPARKLSVRDLAIQPIQRVMRYVLLYRDLLDCTPLASPSRLLVERALEAATRIANHCDRAQRNPAFCHGP